MIKQLPAQRPLPHKDDILDRILADDTRNRRPWLVPVAAAASVAVVAGGLVLATSGPDGEPVPGPAARTTPTKPTTAKPKPKPSDIQVNAGPLGAAEANALAEACVRQEGRAPAPGQVGRVSHAFKVRRWGDPGKTDNSVVVLDKSNGLIWGCNGFPGKSRQPDGGIIDSFEAGLVGGDPVEARKYESVLHPTDATHPAVPTESGGGQYSVEFDNLPDRLAMQTWYRVDERVAKMRQRFVVRGKATPWFVGDAVDGYVFLRSWDDSTVLRDGDKIRIETQVLARDGSLLDAPADLKNDRLTPSPGTTHVVLARAIAIRGGRAALDFEER